jgi:hypothetical protein
MSAASKACQQLVLHDDLFLDFVLMILVPNAGRVDYFLVRISAVCVCVCVCVHVCVCACVCVCVMVEVIDESNSTKK